MAEKLYCGIVELVCDGCGTESFGPEAAADRDVLRAEARSAGWRCHKDRAGKWCDSCPSCVRDWARGQERRLV